MATLEPLKRAFVTGWPLTSTRSPLIHNAWAKMYGVNATYEALPVSPDRAEAFLSSFAEQGFVGGNVTMPYKDLAFRTANHRDKSASPSFMPGTGSANTVWSENESVHAASTDGFGFLANLDERAPDWDWNASESTALVLGAGGAAVAVIDALLDRGWSKIIIVNRTLERASALALGSDRLEAAEWDELSERLPDVHLLVNTTSLGMAGSSTNDDYPPDLGPLPANAVVNDLVYAPLVTPLLSAARKQGLRHVDGLGMLMHQAVPGFEHWFGVRPEVSARLRHLVVRDLGEREPVFLGLTGSIGMGKSTTAAMFAEAGIPVHDADATVHALYRGALVAPIEAAFPGTTGPDGVDRAKLGATVIGNAEAMKRLEAIVHPLVRAKDYEFRARIAEEGHPLAILDIPLLFETKGERRCESVIVVSAPTEVQRDRVLSRETMSEAQFKAVLDRQVPDAAKRERADFVIDTSQGLAHARSRVRDIVAQVSDANWMPRINRLPSPNA